MDSGDGVPGAGVNGTGRVNGSTIQAGAGETPQGTNIGGESSPLDPNGVIGKLGRALVLDNLPAG